jgi:4-amino-4-deoxy-L-arabinose transferase-like glycosyltransferase
MNIGGTIDKIDRKLRGFNFRKKIIFYLALTAIIYGATIPVNFLWVSGLVGPEVAHADIYHYRERTQTILNGDLLYRDVHTETPPLVNYLMIPAQLLGGSHCDWVWSIYFSFFAFLTACLLYVALRRWDDYSAFLTGLLALVTPFSIIDTSVGQDESLVAFVFLISVVLMLYERNRLAAAAIAAGIWTKMFAILLVPIQFLRLRSSRGKMSFILIVLAVTSVVALPFAVLCYDDFARFINFYFLGESGRPTGGSSMWHFLRMGGLGIPNEIELGIVLASFLLTYMYCHRKRMGVWESVTLVLIVFAVFYPKIHTGYYIMLVALLSVWAVKDWKIAMRLFLAYPPIIISAGFAMRENGQILIQFEGSWLVGFALILIGTLLLVDAARLAFKKKSFIHEPMLRKVEASQESL